MMMMMVVVVMSITYNGKTFSEADLDHQSLCLEHKFHVGL
jgi:hypothetical protein